MTYALWVNQERTVFVRMWESGNVEVAMRESPWHTWGPPVYLTKESVVTGPSPEASPPLGSTEPSA